MSIIKISVFLRSFELVGKYKTNNSRDLWEDLTNRIKEITAPADIFHAKKGSFLHFFYFASEKSAGDYSVFVSAAADSLFPDEKERKAVNISVAEMTPSDLEELKRAEADKGGNENFWAAVDLALAAETKAAPRHIEEIIKEGQSDGIPETEKKDAPVAEPEDKSLSGRAKRIKELKEGLLSAIKGQRHAVDEVVQTVFECEMFASRNPVRKGPLATFLFTGPSGVGKTYLAETCGKLLGRKMLVVDMSEYSDNLANGKFNGNFNQPAIVTSFVRENPDGILVFDEIEKAHMNTIHLFLQILDAARLMDHKVGHEVSFKDNIIIMTTNAGKSLYDDPGVCDLSETSRAVILDALRTDINPATREPFFPECITTRMANGHVILFNHLEPFSLMEIVRDEIKLQVGLFEGASGIKVEYDPDMLAALVMYNGGGLSDARTLRGLAKNTVVHELQEIVMQIYASSPDKVNELREISLSINTEESDAVKELFVGNKTTYAVVFSDKAALGSAEDNKIHNTVFEVISQVDTLKRRVRGLVDYVLIDPMCGAASSERVPNDIEDIDSDGMRMFDYIREFSPETPIYIMDTSKDHARSFDTLLARGARGIVECDSFEDESFKKTLAELSFKALINNSVYSLGRSNKYLTFNCAQYILDDTHAVISFERLQVKSAPKSKDSALMAKKGENNNLKFSDIVGCKGAKEALGEYCKMMDNPREVLSSEKRMPKGVLLYGPPGTGKTMLAKAMANECNATFFPTSATSFFNCYVGETERNIRELFQKARRYAPSIIFIDEVDAIGRERVGASTTAHTENALNAFLAEMDGFVTDEKRPVFILAATNYDISGKGGRVLDAAFVRRFDSKILIPLPDTDDRYELLLLGLKKHGINFGADHEKIVRNMAERTGGMSNADLSMLTAQFVRELGDGEPDGAKYLDTLDSFRFGEINKMDPEALKQTAYHEAGHALVCRLCGVTPSFLTVVSRGGYGGFMEGPVSNNKGTYTFDELMNMVCRCLAGRVAEIAVYGNSVGLNTGASSDIKQARHIIKTSLDDYAMGDNLFAHWKAADAEGLMRAQYERTEKMLRDNIGTLEKLATLLCEKKSLDKAQMEAFFESEKI